MFYFDYYCEINRAFKNIFKFIVAFFYYIIDFIIKYIFHFKIFNFFIIFLFNKDVPLLNYSKLRMLDFDNYQDPQ